MCKLVCRYACERGAIAYKQEAKMRSIDFESLTVVGPEQMKSFVRLRVFHLWRLLLPPRLLEMIKELLLSLSAGYLCLVNGLLLFC